MHLLSCPRRLCALILLAFLSFSATAAEKKPNFVVIFCDDLGYGDLGCYGNPTIATPHLDKMAAEGMKFTQFYSAASVCTPSRAALLTGRLPVRSGMASDQRRVLFPDSPGGLPASEVTLPEALKTQGYKTSAVGKWHLGHLPKYLPTRNGFDEYFGIPYSNDMDRVASAPKGRDPFWDPKVEYWNVPLLRGEKVEERPADQTTITKRYTEEAVDFIERNKEKPFFLYLAHSMPHVPLFTSKEFNGKSRRGLYGDVIEEIDWSVGQVMKSLREQGLEKDTVVFFTSDNGPWLIFNDHGGSAGLLRDGKGCTWDGGMREPGIVWWPGTVKAGSVNHELASTMDIYTTCLTLAGANVPEDRVVDGKDMTPMLKGTGPSLRDSIYYYRGERLYAVRKGAYKAHMITQGAYDRTGPTPHETPLLYNLDVDPSEKWDVAAKHPEILAGIREDIRKHNATLVRGRDQLAGKIGKWESAFNSKDLTGWMIPNFAGAGEVLVEKKDLVIEMGESLSGLTYTNDVPRADYELELEAMKIQGQDFFCALTFPVKTNSCSLVMGGWGGAVVGISSVDHQDASDNETTEFIRFDPGKWFKIKVRVTESRIEAWLDGESIVDLDTTDRFISMRLGDIELNAPMGLANYQTASKFRNIRFRYIDPNQIKRPAKDE